MGAFRQHTRRTIQRIYDCRAPCVFRWASVYESNGGLGSEKGAYKGLATIYLFTFLWGLPMDGAIVGISDCQGVGIGYLGFRYSCIFGVLLYTRLYKVRGSR